MSIAVRPLAAAPGIAVLAVAYLTAIPSNAESIRIDAPPDGVEIGLGWDSRRNRLVDSRCIRFAPIQEGGQHSTLDLTEVSDSSELRKHLGVSASAQIHGLAGSGSASASFTQDVDVTSTSTNFAVRASVTNGVMFIGPEKPPSLRRYAFSATQPVSGPEYPLPPVTTTSESVSLAPWLPKESLPTDAAGSERFLALCGDSFVSAIYSGVELFTVISFESSAGVDKSALSAEIEASYGIGAGKASFTDDTEKQFKSANTRMHFFQRGGAGGTIPSSREELVQKLQSIAAEANNAPEFFDIAITPYSDLPDWQYGPIQPQNPYTDSVVERYLQLRTLYRDLQDVIDNPGNYMTECFGTLTYMNLQDRIGQAVALLERTQLYVVENNWTPDSQDKFLKQLQQLGIDTPASIVRALHQGPQFGVTQQSFDDTQPDKLIQWLNENLSIAYLKTLLPPRMSDALSCKGKQDSFQAAVISEYVRPANERICNVRASDPSCLSNRALNILQRSVKYPSSLPLESGHRGHLCIGGSDPVRRCVAWLDSGDGVLQLTEDINQASMVELVDAGPEHPGVFRLKVTKSESEQGTYPDTVFKREQEGNHDYMFRVGTNRGSDVEIFWKPVEIKASKTTALLASTRGGAKGKSQNDCLLWEPFTGNVLVYPNGCQPTGSYNPPHYTWFLYKSSDIQD